ncbi:MAG: anti-sigma F factor [Clostridiales bacterium]|jgi:stage II sporulation protein AB (anti-sigma F factor)|nr:anti-sigma F factor [Clostridiales bacterium]
MTYDNEVSISMSARSQNEAFARVAAAAFVAPFDPLLNDLTDIKTAVSEAVTNAIIHGYENKEGIVFITFRSYVNEIFITVTDEGVGIEDLEQAMTPLYTSKPELERSGMGFTVMEAFMDHVEVTSAPGRGTTVEMRKAIARQGLKSDFECLFTGLGGTGER